MADDLQLAIFAAVVAVFVFVGSLATRVPKETPDHRLGKAFLIAVNIAKLPNVPRQILKDIPWPQNAASRDDWAPKRHGRFSGGAARTGRLPANPVGKRRDNWRVIFARLARRKRMVVMIEPPML